MDFSDIDVKGQYATTLPKELWNPSSFPKPAYKEELSKSQQNLLKKREKEKRGNVDFVPATDSGESSSNGNFGQKSAVERVMAGLEKGRSNSPQVSKKKKNKVRILSSEIDTRNPPSENLPTGNRPSYWPMPGAGHQDFSPIRGHLPRKHTCYITPALSSFKFSER